MMLIGFSAPRHRSQDSPELGAYSLDVPNLEWPACHQSFISEGIRNGANQPFATLS